MTNHSEYNKIIKRLDGRHFRCKTFYDYYWEPVMNCKYEIYLKQEVDAILKQLKELYESQKDKIDELKKKNNDLELENYKLKRRKRKTDENTNGNTDTYKKG